MFGFEFAFKYAYNSGVSGFPSLFVLFVLASYKCLCPLFTLPFPVHPNKGNHFLLWPCSAFVAASSLFPITVSVNNPHLNEGTCIESPLWSGAAELCHSSQRCYSQWASRKTPSLPTGATVPHLPCSSKLAANLCQKETTVLLPSSDKAQEHRQTSLNPPFLPTA